ncbi:MAG: hypothetical protein RMX96_04865 [Nostoc sp. ChiSLP02]|nr:hypothetical protein [Nostoc sp. DedSLP05]MDZ8102810.1 hypothetical protein [Nostoc sp. DedSLP01]MDZ8184180.1 hypothetical protein [Nostoc sp. ChiSLP02]
MSLSKTTLTVEQSALIPIYKEKWQKIFINSDIIDRSKARANTLSLYRAAELSKPKIIFVDTLYIALDIIIKEFVNLVLNKHTGEHLIWGILFDILCKLWGGSIWTIIDRNEFKKICTEISSTDEFAEYFFDLIPSLSATMRGEQNLDFSCPSLAKQEREVERVKFAELRLNKDDLERLNILKGLTDYQSWNHHDVFFDTKEPIEFKNFRIDNINIPSSNRTLFQEIFGYFMQIWDERERIIIRDLLKQSRLQLQSLIKQYFPLNQLEEYDFFKIIDRYLGIILENHYIRGNEGMWLPKLSIAYGCYYDFCYSVLGVNSLHKELEVLEDFFLNCYWIFPFQDVCLISGRPSKNKLMKLGISPTKFA